MAITWWLIVSEPKRFKLFMCDLDGTLVGKGHVKNHADQQALTNALESGLLVSICTGRSWRESHHLIADLQLDIPGVFSNGAELNSIATGESIAVHPFSINVIQELLSLCTAWNLNPIILLHQRAADDPLYVVDDLVKLHPATTDWFRRNGVSNLITNRLDDDMLQRCLRVGLVMESSAAVKLTQHMEAHFRNKIHFHLLQALHFDIAIVEIFRHGVDKWSGILRLCDQLGIDPQDVATIGDDVNDIPMLRNARMSYAMGSAPEHVRSSAKKTTLEHAQNGVAAAIADLLGAEPMPG